MHKILLVEDSDDIRTLLKREFKNSPVSADWEIIEACDGLEALDIIDNEKIRLVITDVMMPNMDGLELVKTVKARDDCRDLPIIVISDAEKSETDLLELGAVDFYSKPICDYKPLITKIRTHIDAYLQVINLKRTLSIATEKTKQLEDEKAKARSAAIKKSEFIASMSHELRSPLNSIIGFAERIPPRIERIGDNLNGLISYIDSLAPENGGNGKNRAMEIIDDIRVKEINTVKEFCGYIRNSGSHLLDLINDLLDLSKIEADKMSLFPEVVDFSSHVESVIASYRNIAEEKNLELSCDVNEISPFIYVDKVRFDQILFNLVGNAVKFSKPGGVVKISARELPGEGAVEFCVIDKGEGIPEEFREYVFTRFERADRSGVKIGIGLGLAIAKKLVELMGGRIWFESVPGRGSSFYFTVPAGKVCKVG